MQAEPGNVGVAGIEEGQAALRRQLNSQASGLSAADRAASAPSSAGALAAADGTEADLENGAGAAQRTGSARPPGSMKPPRGKRSRAARLNGEPGAAGVDIRAWHTTSRQRHELEHCTRFCIEKNLFIRP